MYLKLLTNQLRIIATTTKVVCEVFWCTSEINRQRNRLRGNKKMIWLKFLILNTTKLKEVWLLFYFY